MLSNSAPLWSPGRLTGAISGEVVSVKLSIEGSKAKSRNEVLRRGREEEGGDPIGPGEAKGTIGEVALAAVASVSGEIGAIAIAGDD